MYTMENYYWGLVAYVLGVMMLTPLLWWLTRPIPWRPIKAFFRLLVLTFLLTPMYAYQGMDYLAPAWVVAVFELIKPQTDEGIWHGLLPIAVCFVIVYCLDLVLWLLFRKRQNNTGREAESSVIPPATQA